MNFFILGYPCANTWEIPSGASRATKKSPVRFCYAQLMSSTDRHTLPH